MFCLQVPATVPCGYGRVCVVASRIELTMLAIVPSGNCLAVMAGHSAAVTCGGFFAQGMRRVAPPPLSLTLSAGKRIMSGSEDGTVRLWDPKTGAVTGVLTGSQFHEDAVVSLSASEEAPLLLSGSADMTAKLSHADSLKVLLTLAGHEEVVLATAFCKVYAHIE